MDIEKQSKKQEEFESEQNLFGLFSILLQVDKRLNPENYQFIKDQKQND